MGAATLSFEGGLWYHKGRICDTRFVFAMSFKTALTKTKLLAGQRAAGGE